MLFRRNKNQKVVDCAHPNTLTEEEIKSVYESAREDARTRTNETLEEWIRQCLNWSSSKINLPKDCCEWNKRERTMQHNRNNILTRARMKAYVRELESRSCECVIA